MLEIGEDVGFTSVTAQLTRHASTLACQLTSTWMAKDYGPVALRVLDPGSTPPYRQV
jgi:hypothetical protein